MRVCVCVCVCVCVLRAIIVVGAVEGFIYGQSEVAVMQRDQIQ